MKKLLSILIATFSVAVYAGSPIIWGPTAALNLKPGGIQLQSGQFVANDGQINYLVNPTIETGLVTPGWSLGHVILTSGVPTGTPTFGSGASGNLTLSASNSTPIEGTYSLSLASSAATTAGDFVASDPFTIQNGNLANVVYFQFKYEAISNPGNINFSGSSSNSFMPYIYNVTQGGANWIQPQGLYCQVQGTGTGTCTGSFQATVTDTQYRLVVYNANATAGAETIYYDQFLTGPQPFNSTIPAISWSGTQVSQALTANVTNAAFTTVNDSNGAWNGTQYVVPIAGTYVMAGGALTSAAGTLHGYKNGTSVGNFASSFAATASSGGSIVFTNCVSGDLLSIRSDSSLTITNGQFGIFQVGAGAVGPAGQVVASRAMVSTGASTASTSPINYDTIDFDLTGSITTGVGTWQYKAPYSGIYFVESGGYYGATTVGQLIFKNGSLAVALMQINGGAFSANGSTLLSLNAGDTLQIRPSTTATPTSLNGTTAQTNYISIGLWQGPGQNQNASQPTVAASYYLSANFAATTTTPVNFDTKLYDYCSCVTTSATAWNFKAPSAGLYSIGGFINPPASINVNLYKNGAFYATYGWNTGVFFNVGTMDLRLNSGDTIDVRPSGSVTFSGSTPSPSAGTPTSTITIKRVGN